MYPDIAPNILWNNTSIAEVKEHTRNDPISFILGCKRIACVESQIGLKALLWNRSVYCKEEFAVFSWIGEENIESLGKADDMKLNYFMIAYLVPSKYMFDVDYWRWRVQSNPTEFEIYMKHFSYYAEQFNLDLSEMSKMVEKERFAYILQKRDVDQSEIDSLLEENDVNNDKAQDVEAESKEAVSNDGQAIVDDFQKDNDAVQKALNLNQTNSQ